MFKENKEFWLYIIGTIVLFVFLIFGMKSYFNSTSLALLLMPPLAQPQAVGVTLVYDTPPVINLVKDTDYFARINTNKGSFVIDLFEKNAPNTVNNFVYLASQKYYDGTKFHRLIPGLLLQGGSRNTLNQDSSDDAFGGPGYVINDEINWDSLGLDQATRTELTAQGYASDPKHSSVDMGKYRLAMANAGANTNGSQFFILLSGLDNPDVLKLRGKYTVFAEVIGNREVLDLLGSTKVNNQITADPRPAEDLVITSVEIIQN